jgi:hypothetical protein
MHLASIVSIPFACITLDFTLHLKVSNLSVLYRDLWSNRERKRRRLKTWVYNSIIAGRSGANVVK